MNSEQIIEITNQIDTLKTGDLLLCDNLEQKGLGLFGWLIKYGSKSDFSHIAMVVVNPDFTYLDKPMKGVYVWQSGTAQIPDAEDGKRKIGVQLTPIVDFITTYKGKIYLRRLRVHFAEDIIENNTTMISINITDLNGVGSGGSGGSGGGSSTALVTRNRNLLINTFSNTFSNTFGYIYSGFSILKYFFYKSNARNNNNIDIESNQDSIDTHKQRHLHYHTENPFTHEKMKEIHSCVFNKPYDIVVRDWIEAYCKKDPDPQKISRFWCSALAAFIYTKVGLLDEKTDWSIIRPSFFSSENPELNRSILIGAELSNEELIWCNV
jgi:hypothetical protein